MDIENELIRILIRERPAITAYIRGIVFDQELAEDIYQSTAVVALRKKDQVTSLPGAMSWLLSIARFEALSALRKVSSSPKCFDEEVLDLLDRSWRASLESTSELDHAEALRHCVGKLPEKSKKILTLRYAEGVSGAELAGRLGAKVDSCYVALSRIHARLRECMRAYRARSM